MAHAITQTFNELEEPERRGTSRLVGPARARQPDGWREGRPLEDPAKTKKWGFITAKPSEFLVHCRRGRVLRSSGQGATCFKWPWDSVAVVPTSFQRLQFVADQITLERVGVAVSGLAVYRITEPLLAFRVLNFSYPERAQEKLQSTLTEMLIGATRRLVANLEVDQCLQKRKAALADELLREIAPVVGGGGRLDDNTDGGWGVVLDTVEIQEVRVLSDRVFGAMQQPFRSALDRKAREAKAAAEQKAAVTEADARRAIQRATIDSEAAIRERQEEVERSESERRSEDTLRMQQLALREEEARIADAVRRQQLATEAEAARVEDAKRRQALLVEEAQAEIESYEVQSKARELRSQVQQANFQQKLDMKRASSDLDVAIGHKQAEVAAAQAAAETQLATAKAKVITAEKLPQLASAVGGKFGEVKVTQIGSDGNPFGSIAQAVAGVLELVKQD